MSARGIAPATSSADLLDKVARALADAPDRPLVLTVPASFDPVALLAPGDDACLWIDRDGHATLGRGTAFVIQCRGRGVVADLHEQKARLDAIDVRAIDGAAPLSPRFIGGGAFRGGAADDSDWRGFGNARFVLPALTWLDEAPSGACLQIAAMDRAGRDAALAMLDDVLARATTERARVATVRGALDADRERYRELVLNALGVIEGGPVTKIVAARRARLRADDGIDAQALGARLLEVDGMFRYVVRIGDVTFAGASPERLIEKRDEFLRTEAVAGTAPAEHDDTPLDQREKDKREHLAVVLAIEESLAQQTLALEHADEPQIRKHGRIAHLVTPFEGRVDAATHVLELGQSLHPTPAVAGTPRDVAIDFITRYEPVKRGWYAGPVGWFDLEGDGELAVGLRCVRIEGSAVDLFAGAGIVEGSDPDAEFDETVLKMRSTLASLGLELRA